MDPKPLSTRICLLLILLFGIAAYSNTFNVPFHFDDEKCIIDNQSLRPPLDLGKIWQVNPTRFIANMSFALQYAFTGLAPWGFHCVNLLIHLLASMLVFAIARILLRTPALEETLPPSQRNVFALAPALLFLTHPVQTQAVTYIVQRMASLATLFYLATLWTYLKARLEDLRHYRMVFLFMLAAMLTKEISFTLPFAILLMDLCFFPISSSETILKKLRRWIPFAAFLLIIPLIYLVCTEHLVRSGGTMGILPTLDTRISREDYLLTQFRVLRTYLRLLIFPVNQCLDYDYRLSSGWGDFDTWSAFSLLLGIFIFAVIFFKKNRLPSFGIFWFFLTLSVESSLVPFPDIIFEHRLYLPMLGFSLFLSSLLWQCARSVSRFLALILLLTVVLSGITYARNDVWRNHFTLWQDTIKRSPHKWRPYAMLGEAFAKKSRDAKTALLYYHKALATGSYSVALLSNIATAYIFLGNDKEGAYYQDWALSSEKSGDRSLRGILYFNQVVALRKQKKMPEAINALKKAIETDPQNPFFYINLGELYRETGHEDAAIASFRKAITIAPLSKECYDALALLYKEKGDEQKALAVLMEYLKYKKEHKPLFGN